MSALAKYLSEMARIRGSGEATDETSYYPALDQLLNEAGAQLSPAVHCVLTPKNRGAGIPDGALFLKRSLELGAGADAIKTHTPERGVLEVKGLDQRVERVIGSKQVQRYLERYGQVLVTNYREFLPLRLDPDGTVVQSELFTLAETEAAFWQLVANAEASIDLGAKFEAFLQRVLLADAPLSSPEDLAWFLAAYARTARERVDKAGQLPALETLRTALEDALGLQFEGDEGRDFFHSALVQTLFYGMFAAWVTWCDRRPPNSETRFSWRAAQWSLNVPMVRVLFEQLATPSNLPAGLDEVLDWAEDVFARVERQVFFERFEQREAVRYFYEPFLQAYDPDLRRQLGVWYTPPEVVRYMVGRVHEALKRDLGVELGLADDSVHVLDPCTGTGSFLVEVLRTITEVLRSEHADALVGQHAKEAALARIHGFEVLPAPFIVTHLQLGLLLAEFGAPLDPEGQERVSVYLTNALTGWTDSEEKLLPFNEFRTEREAAGSVKRTEPILVIIGNPPYNGFSGVVSKEEQELVAAYKEGLARPPWEITKNKLDDYYIRFFRIAERRIAEETGRGIICFISNFGWLGDPSAVVMRKRLVREFDQLYVDNLNGDSRETGKRTPAGDVDPSVFAGRSGQGGIQVGTAVSLLVRTEPHSPTEFTGLYRDFWGAAKRQELEASLADAQASPTYEALQPEESNWYRLRRWRPRLGYAAWPLITELAARRPELGLNENRGDALVSPDRDKLEQRMQHFLDPELDFADLDHERCDGLLQPWARYDARATRDRLMSHSAYDPHRIRLFQAKPFDVRSAYIDATRSLWNEPRPEFIAAADVGSDFLLVRNRAPRALDGAAFLLSPHLVDQHVLHKDAYAIPLLLARPEPDGVDPLFEVQEGTQSEVPWRPNLSAFARDYLRELGYDDVDSSRATARLLWLHVLAVGYAPQYLEENGDAIRNGWPRVPLPRTAEALEESAHLGAQIAALLDIDTPLPGIDTSAPDELQSIAAIRRFDASSVSASDLAISAGWGRVQIRTQRSGAISRIVMPGEGVAKARARQPAECEGLELTDVELLGDEVLDVYLNDHTCWSGVPQAVWGFKIGGFQVLRKWLSYREFSVLGRPLTFVEARQFRSIARRLTKLVLMGPELDGSYRAVIGAVDQDALPEFATAES
jgi:hypothetical protein